MPPTSVLLSFSTADDVGDSIYSGDVTELQLRLLPVTLRCHVTVLSANHVLPNVTVSFGDADMTSQFVRTRSSASQDGGPTDYVTELEWNVTLNSQLLDLHASNWTCSAVTSHYPPLVTSSLVYVARNCSNLLKPTSDDR